MRREEGPKAPRLLPPSFQRDGPGQWHGLARVDVCRVGEGARVGYTELAF
jgi:hypothetical protein